MFEVNLNKAIRNSLEQNGFDTIKIQNVIPVSGGSINETYCVATNKGKFFIKKNDSKRFPKMFEKEAKGLEILQNTNTIRTPKVIVLGESEEVSFLILEYIESKNPKSIFWEEFGAKLASLHQCTTTTFGLDYDNYIGSLYQQNNFHTNWTDFFIEERLQIQIKLARDHHQIESATISKFEKLYNRLDDIFPKEQPALLHGDLWSGNFIVDEKGAPVIMDPAVYYGHREMEIAMTKLFGGFDNQFYDAYNAHFQLEKGWQNRMDICNLYPLMVHVNLFGGSYLNQVKNIIAKF